MNLYCRLVKHKWEHCKCARCGQRRDEEHVWDGCVCAVCGMTRDEAHTWTDCKCQKCGKIRNTNHRWNGCKCQICGRTRDEEHNWDGCRCRMCGKTRSEGHEPDKTDLKKFEKWCFGMTLIRPYKNYWVKCRGCSTPLWELSANHFYCPQCYKEVEPQYEESNEPTIMKYRVKCKHCGFDKVGRVSDG